jgi:hypothetical protein
VVQDLPPPWVDESDILTDMSRCCTHRPASDQTTYPEIRIPSPNAVLG